MAPGSAAVSLWRVGSLRQRPVLLPPPRVSGSFRLAVLLIHSAFRIPRSALNAPFLRFPLSPSLRFSGSPMHLCTHAPRLLCRSIPFLRVLGVPVSSIRSPRSQWSGNRILQEGRQEVSEMLQRGTAIPIVTPGGTLPGVLPILGREAQGLVRVTHARMTLCWFRTSSTVAPRTLPRRSAGLRMRRK
jgi:hypothetical protein